MASVNQLVLLNGAVSGNTDTAAVSLESLQTDHIGTLVVSAIGAGTSLVVKLQRSVDAVTWFDWITFAAKTSAVNELVAATTAGLSYVRANLVFTGGTTTATAKVVLSFDKKSK